MQCKWPNCSEATKCDICGDKLCRFIETDHHRVIGHFVLDNKCYCERCWHQRHGEMSNHIRT